MTDEETITKAEAVALVEAASKKAFDEGHMAGAAVPAGEGQAFFEFSNKRTTRRVDVAHENYMAELKPLLSELRSEGVRNLRSNPRVLALRARHGQPIKDADYGVNR